jgi:hypothetical protein
MRSLQVCVLFLLGASVSCSDDVKGPVFAPVPGDFSSIEDPHERWQAYNLQDYRIVESRSCFCPGPYRWTAYVKGGKVVSVRIYNPEQDTEEMRDRALAMAWTVEEAFTTAEQIKNGEADIRVVEYSERYGYPTRMYRDYTGVTDGGLSLGNSDLEAVVAW